MPLARNTTGTDVTFANSDVYKSYKLIFPENRGPDGGAVNSIQFAEVQFGGTAVPEPATASLALLAWACSLRAVADGKQSVYRLITASS
jgi:hypothetical protein